VQARRDSTDRIRLLYRLVYQREPTKTQLRLGLEFVQSSISEPPSAPVTPIASAWQYGYGEYDESAQRLKSFERLRHFTGDAWQGGPNWPDDKLGWVQLTADGGHAGNDLKHAAVRRWVAPRDGIVSISGAVKHEHQPGDGITARVVSSRSGSLGHWTVHNGKAEAKIERTEVSGGDTIDFVVDLRANLNSDMFKRAPLVHLIASNATKEATEWSAPKELRVRQRLRPSRFRRGRMAQVLLEANEFFVD
jgi:hypothetical protein